MTLSDTCGPAIRVPPLNGDARALDRIGLEYALSHCVLPLQPAGAIRPVALGGKEPAPGLREELENALGRVAFLRTSREAIEVSIVALRARYLTNRATRRTSECMSCRQWSRRRMAEATLLILGLLCLAFTLWPMGTLLALTFWATLTLFLVSGIRAVGALVELVSARRSERLWKSGRNRQKGALPTMSVLVPLFHEKELASSLVAHLDRLEYPRNRLEAVLILEAGDKTTERALAGTTLPHWIRVVTVPPGFPQTKPRALNYALDFARGDIIGIYDAEDRPACDQLRTVAARFAAAPDEVACLQGVLDFYNVRQSWLTRCFAIDYAAWFRLVLPGLARLGLVVPLGGTTVFFRRMALEELGRWDAYNVTEDADLGVRLARAGFRTEFVATTTEEEATARVGAWLRQRSRWIKGYAITWAVHMRDPIRLWRDLGTWRFFGLQIVFLGTLSQFALAPLLWSFWALPLGLPHPILTVAPTAAIIAVAVLFFLAEALTLSVAAFAVSTVKHRRLIWWVPLLHIYFPLAAVASWKAFFELMTGPFYWDKTAHGQAPLDAQSSPAAASAS